MRRTVAVIAGVALFAAAGAGGFAVAQVLDDEAEGISDAEHDRLVDACVAQTDDTPGCVEWIAETVARANEQDVSYAELSSLVAEELAEQQSEDEQRAADAQARRDAARLREMCDLVESLESGEPPPFPLPTTAPGQVDVCETLEATDP